MPTREKPRDLHDISHLFLSRGRSAGPRGAPVEAVLWLVSLGAGGNRAFFAAGFAAAAAAQGVHVTLLEIGGGLPNIGYYLSLGPEEYAASSADPSRLVSGSAGPRLRYLFSAGIERLERHDPPAFAADSPRLLVAALDRGIGRGAVESVVSRWLPEHGGRPDALCCFGGPDDRIEREVLLDGLRRDHREAFLLDLAKDSAAGGSRAADETFAVPERLVSSWAGRRLPEDPFFGDVVSHLLQVLSYRRKRVKDHAAG
ncbi:MAG TPA: hypothetical protein ENO08_02270 [Candidatus Eisenbacteria bacterium]|uniref:Uncharacterized protein n=1 Tax=Eiseniibacteriota bacterium TaxID=2212470 RepID=A0A7V2AU40_UNCEI|nr:hypothetical protein [Candidatus Eisenbacteria bacterium]